MKILMNVKSVMPERSGSRADGSLWTAWPVVFESPSGEDEMVVELFRQALPEAVRPGTVGWLTVHVSATMGMQSGRLFNNFRFMGFAPLEQAKREEKAATATETATESTETGAPVSLTIEGEKMRETAVSAKNMTEGNEEALPF